MVNICKELLLFVTGFHHSGTTLLQHMLLRELGYNTNHRYQESYPSSCNSEEILKNPTNGLGALEYVIANITVPVVWIERDAPNTIWSIMKRAKKTSSVALLHEIGQKICMVKCAARQYNFTRVYLHSIAKSKKIPDSVLQLLRRQVNRKLSALPADHSARRSYQATHAVYDDDYDTCFRESNPALHPLLESYSTCMC
jgi:hypothetical protein